MENTLTAKEYYYKKIAPEEAGMSYQGAYQSSIRSQFPNEEFKIAIDHNPSLSNDILIDSYMTELIGANRGAIKNRLKKTFVAKIKNYRANAGAVHAKGKFNGDLIFFNVGLSDACFQYAILFAEFLEISKLRRDNGDHDPSTIKAISRLCSDSAKIGDAQVSWSIAGNVIRLTEEKMLLPDPEILDTAVELACCMDKMILRHELAHHFLGHTGDQIREVSLSERVESWLIESSIVKEHQNEFEADIGSVYLSCGESSLLTDDIRVQVILGTLLAMTVMGQLVSDIHSHSLSHPSTASRFLLMQSHLKTNMGSKFYDSIESDVNRFQLLLFTVQNRGLGQLHGQLLQTLKEM